jgi:hypothetical protein
MKPFWDFDENINYTIINGYKVLNTPDAIKSSKLLESIDIYIQMKLLNLRKTVTFYPKKFKPGLDILLNTPCFFQEIQISTINWPVPFVGLNKPKNIVEYKKIPSVGKDKKLRASYRIIFLSLRDQTGKLKTLKQLKPLIIHEITHTACNHVRFRDDDHGKDFIEYEAIIKGL